VARARAPPPLPSPLQIRDATVEDCEAILAIYNQAIPKRTATADLEPQSLAARRQWFTSRDLTTRPVIVAVVAPGGHGEGGVDPSSEGVGAASASGGSSTASGSADGTGSAGTSAGTSASATAPGTIVGWASFTNFKDRSAYSPTAEISVYVADGAAGRGVGSGLVDSLLARAPRCGIDKVLAVTFEHNGPSMALFASRGFTQWGRLPDACEMDGVRRSVAILGLSL
jgi:L-amino acid N-acyltransferase YncA